jgi:hypothetical protein
VGLLALVGASISVTWADFSGVPEEWKSKSMAELVELADQLLQNEAPNATQLSLLGEYVADKYPTMGSVPEADRDKWLELIGKIGKYIPAGKKAPMGESIRTTVAPNDNAIGSLSVTKVRLAGDAWDALGQMRTASSVYASWIANSDAFKALPPSELTFYMGAIVRFGQPSQAARDKLIPHIETTYLADATKAKAVNPATWQRIVAHLKPMQTMSADKRADWGSGLRAAFAGSEAAIGQLSGDNMAALLYALDKLQDRKLPGLLAAWVKASQAWKSWSVFYLAKASPYLERSGDDGVPARAALASHVESTYLADAAKIRSVNCWNWHSLLNCTAPVLSAKQREAWADKLLAAYGGSADTLKALFPNRAYHLIAGLMQLDAGRAAELALAWFDATGSGKWQDYHTSSLARLARLAAGAEAAGALTSTSLLTQLDQQWEQKNGQKPFPWSADADIARVFLAAGNKAKGQQWAMRAYEAGLGTPEARNAAGVGRLGPLAHLLYDAGLTGPQKGYQAMAEVLARLARTGKLYSDKRGRLCALGWQRRKLGFCLAKADVRNILQAELADAAGSPRLDVAKILSHAYRLARDSEGWQALLDQKISQSDAADVKATWLLARAYAESVETRVRSPLLGKQWLSQALATAQSGGVKLLAVQELVRGYMLIHNYTAASSLLDSVAGQFQGDDAAQIEELREQVTNAKDSYAAFIAEHRRLERKKADDAYRRELKRRLAKARNSGDQKTVARLEQLLGE